LKLGNDTPRLQYNLVKSAENDIKDIFKIIQFNSPQGAINVIQDSVLSLEKLVFSEQYQIEEFKPDCRRIIVRNYKILYKINSSKKPINIVRVFDSRQNPQKLKKFKP